MALKLLLIAGLVFLVGRAATADASAVLENLVETLEDGWTRWFDRDDPLPTEDNESLCEHRIENPGEICRRPSGIQARVKGRNTPATQT
ncbi:Hypp2445 [Branchiostoma lanceolatum]|uniref:Hypp2445 protein n=1 Tax=Branchiostoma lanceolatum TaxID=7740 RepID=A0A8K0EMP5_BRALA|nr:Hypp2445 [Branchiostoma lanceolatum]